MICKIKSIYTIREIFSFIKTKRKLNIIKYSKKFAKSLDITKKDFKSYELLQEFNQTYGTKIEDIDTDEIDLSEKKIGNEGLKAICNIYFKYLTSLNLCDNDISNITALSKANLKN